MPLPFLSSEEYDELAHKHYDAGEYDQALEVLREGLGHYPDSLDLLLGLGYVRLAREEYAWARQVFDAALQLDAEHEDAWVGLGETLLKFGRHEAALAAFAQTEALEVEDPLELGLAVGRVLYREGLYHDARQRFTALQASHSDSAEVLAGLAYTLHALGDELGARRELRRALQIEPDLYDARIYLSHLLHERGDLEGALRELERVPPAEHWDSLPLWRLIELRCALRGCRDDDPSLEAWRARIAELDAEPDAVDHLLAEVEAAFEGASTQIVKKGSVPKESALGESALRESDAAVRRIRTADGEVFCGTWDEIVAALRDSTAEPTEPIDSFMQRASRRVKRMLGRELPCHDAEAFVRASAELGLLRIED